jgi:glyoxylase-like metal-dependent hydrolase (beta-lactamase superfamily II)
MAQIERFMVGAIECEIVPDGAALYQPADLFAGVPADQITAAISVGLDENGEMAVPYNCLLIRSGGRIALVDAGLGAEAAMEWGEPTGRLMDSLAASGVTADQVDLVIISHAHLDHIGGLTVAADGGRVPVFARARHYFCQAEWDFWSSDEAAAQFPDLAGWAGTHLPPLSQAGLVELISEETEVLPGVRLVPAPGHTPGHLVVALASGDDAALYLGDAVLDEANFAHPDWVSVFEWNPGMAVATRRALIDGAIAEDQLLVGSHLAMRGYAERAGDQYRLRHVGAQVSAAD